MPCNVYSTMFTDMMLALPPLTGERDVINAGEQSVKDITTEVINAHKAFAADYDCITFFFIGKNILRTLFDFCQDFLPYVMETEHLQTTRSPGAILALADFWGCDCKHYSGWIGGVIDACNRAGLTNFEWCYRFASYDPFDQGKGHVFIVVWDNGREIWIDPAPIENFDGSFTARTFNDRKIIPFYQTDYIIKSSTMSLQRISGCCPDNAYIGYVQAALDPYDMYDTGWNILPFETTNGGGGTVFYDPGFVAPDTVTTDPDPTVQNLPVTTDNTTYAYQPTIDPNTYGKIETVTKPDIVDYPQTTGEPVNTLPGQLSVTGTSEGISIIPDFSIGDFIKTNPVESALIGTAALVGLWLIFKPKKKKRS